MNRTLLTLILTLILSVSSLQAQRGLKLQQMKLEQRVALVIGNNNYDNLANLQNPINDARAMKKILQSRGFDVVYKENASKIDMVKLLKKFNHKLKRGGVGLYYFAGHGVNIEGKNFLVGTDSSMDDKDTAMYDTLALNLVTRKMKQANNRLNIVILDACRNDPFSRSGGGGLAPVSDAKGMFVAYATEAGSVASDGKSGKNGIFTKHLIANMQEKGATIEKVFKNTRADVYDATGGKQSPGVYNQIRGDFFFTLPNKNIAISKPKEQTEIVPTKTTSIEPEKVSVQIDKNSPIRKDILKIMKASDNHFETFKGKEFTDSEKEAYIDIKLKKASYIKYFIKIDMPREQAIKAYENSLSSLENATYWHSTFLPKESINLVIAQFKERPDTFFILFDYPVDNLEDANSRTLELQMVLKEIQNKYTEGEWNLTELSNKFMYTYNYSSLGTQKRTTILFENCFPEIVDEGKENFMRRKAVSFHIEHTK